MIKKLEPYNSSKSSIDGYHWEYHPNMEDVINKVNEIIDAVNANSLGFSMPFGEYRWTSGGKSKDTKKDESIKHGHWIKNNNGTYSCSECKACIPNEQHYHAKYCLSCGAKMDEE